MRIYVAFRTDVDPPTRMASGSFTTLKDGKKNEKGKKVLDGMKDAGPGAEFTVVEYNFKPNLVNVCQAIADVTELDAESAKHYRINDHNQLREVKE